MQNKNQKRKIISNFLRYWMEILPINIRSLYSFSIFLRFLVLIWFLTFNLSSSNDNVAIVISRFQILTACNCIIYFQYSVNVENDHFNDTSDHQNNVSENTEIFFHNISSIAKSLCQIFHFCYQCSIITKYYVIFEAGNYYCMFLDFPNWLIVILHFVSYLEK